MNSGKFKVFAKILLVAGSLLAAAILPANAELLVGISFPSQGSGEDEIDESLLTLPRLRLQETSWFGPENTAWSSDPLTKFSTTCTKADIHYLPNTTLTNIVFPSYSYSFGPAKFDLGGLFSTSLPVREQLPPSRSVSVDGKKTPTSSSASDSSISVFVLPTAPQSAGGMLNVTLKQNTFQLDWPADHTGWILQIQTNSPGDPPNPEWFPVAGSTATNHFDLILDRANNSVFFRLVAP